jgi:hypothetical protein
MILELLLAVQLLEPSKRSTPQAVAPKPPAKKFVSVMSSSRSGLMTAEQWNSYLLDFCLRILRQKKRE